MIDAVSTIVVHARSAWRFRWWAVLAAWVLALGGWAAVMLAPNSYESHARVYVDADSVLKPLLAGLAVGTDVRTRVAMMAKVVLARPALEKVAREADLSLRAKNQEQLDTLLQSLTKRISLIGTPDGIYTISYADRDPKMAQRVVQLLLNTFVEDTLGLKREDSSSAQTFLEQQLKEYESRLRSAEERLADFKRRNVGLMPGQAGDYYTRMQTGMTNLDTLKAKQRQLTERRNELSRQLEGEEPSFGLVLPTAKAGRNDAKIAELKSKLDVLLVQYTEKYPEVISIRETIARLEAENRQAAASQPATTVDSSKIAMRQLDINPVYQSMKIALSQTDAELAELRTQIVQQEQDVAGLRSRVNTVPEVEAQLAQLTRDYEVDRAQYTQLLQRMESARISEQAERSSDNVKFRVVEPPVVPVLTAGPSKPLLMTGVLLLAIGAAGALAFVLSLLRPVFTTRLGLQHIIGLPVLGSISLVHGVNVVPWYRRQAVLVSGCTALLFVVYLGGVLAT